MDPVTLLWGVWKAKKTLLNLMTQWQGLFDSFAWPWPLCSKYSNVLYHQILSNHYCIYQWIFETHCLKWIKYIVASLLWVKCMISSTTMTSKHLPSSAYTKSILCLSHISRSPKQGDDMFALKYFKTCSSTPAPSLGLCLQENLVIHNSNNTTRMLLLLLLDIQ